MIVYHYTVLNYLPRIAEARALLPTSVGIDPGERPALWFTARRSYEPTAYKSIGFPDGTMRLGGYADLFTYGGGALRFGRDRAGLTPWVAFRRGSGITSAKADALAREAKRVGSNPVRDWYVSYEPVTACAVVEIQREAHEPWVPFDLEAELARAEREMADITSAIGGSA